MPRDALVKFYEYISTRLILTTKNAP
jgi:hypothetical protein